MMMKIGPCLKVIWTIVGLCVSACPAAFALDDYDRLDGTGRSGKKIHVIEWAGNLEIHAYPAGSLAGLALKLDKRNKNKPVMVIGYRFKDNPAKQLVRRAILGYRIEEGFKVYRDPRETEFDKIIISNNGLSKALVNFILDPEPKTLYPKGHPALLAAETAEKPVLDRQPSSVDPQSGLDLESASAPSLTAGPPQKEIPPSEGYVDDHGSIQPYQW